MVVIMYVGIVPHHLHSNIINLLGFSKLGKPARLKPWQRTMAARLARERLTYAIEYRCVTCLGPQRLTVRISYAVVRYVIYRAPWSLPLNDANSLEYWKYRRSLRPAPCLRTTTGNVEHGHATYESTSASHAYYGDEPDIFAPPRLASGGYKASTYRC
jgi:hypothetical protein